MRMIELLVIFHLFQLRLNREPSRISMSTVRSPRKKFRESAKKLGQHHELCAQIDKNTIDLPSAVPNSHAVFFLGIFTCSLIHFTIVISISAGPAGQASGSPCNGRPVFLGSGCCPLSVSPLTFLVLELAQPTNKYVNYCRHFSRRPVARSFVRLPQENVD